MFMPNRRARLSDDAAEQIRERVGEWGLEPGDRLPPERELATRLGVGRTSIREGLRTLELSGIVEVIPSKGVFLTADPGQKVDRALTAWLAVDRGNQLDLVEFRAAVDGQAAALTAVRATPVELAAIGRGVAAFGAAIADGDRAAILTLDTAFHDDIARASRNGLLRRVRAVLAPDLAAQVAAQVESGPTPDVGSRLLDDHTGIVAALRARDSVAARAIIERHVGQIAVDLGIIETEVGAAGGPTVRR